MAQNPWLAMAGIPDDPEAQWDAYAQQVAAQNQQQQAQEDPYSSLARIAQMQAQGGQPTYASGALPNQMDIYSAAQQPQQQQQGSSQQPVGFSQSPPSAGNGLSRLEREYLMLSSKGEKAAEEEQAARKAEIEKLKSSPAAQFGLGNALAAAADLWGGGKGQFTQLYNSSNPQLTKEQKAEQIAKLEAAVRQGRNDILDSQLGRTKAQIGFEEARMKKGEGVQLPAGQAADLGDLSTIDSQVSDMANQWQKRFGNNRSSSSAPSVSDKLAALIPGTDANTFDSQRRQWAQQIGTVLEHGKLSDKDYDKYLDNFIPGPFDSVAKADTKIKALQNYANTKKQAMLNSFKMAGYKVGNYNQPQGGGLSADENARMQELLAKKAAGTLR